MKFRMIVVAAAVLALLITGASVAMADDWNVDPGDSIQAAVDSAADGDTIYVHEGTYDESIVIDGKDVSLIAVGSVILAPSACTSHSDVIQIHNGVVRVEGFDVDASPCMSGIYAGGRSWEGEGSVDVMVKNNDVYGYDKNGITVNGDLANGRIFDNHVTGSGPVGPGYWAQNGIQFGYGATGKAMGNTVDANWYTGELWGASGILVFEADEVMVQRNTVLNSQTAIAIEAWGWFLPTASYNRVVANTITNAEWGVSVAAYDLGGYSSSDASANNNKVVNNVIVGSNGNNGEVGVSIWAGTAWGGAGTTPSADNNKVIRNDISGFAINISDDGTATKRQANIPLP